MGLWTILVVSLGASLGALFRFWLGVNLNSLFPTLPLGTLFANLIGGFLMGLFISFTKQYAILSGTMRLFIATGFLGGLTTFSTFSGEVTSLILQEQYVWGVVATLSHVLGSLLATIAGIYFMKLCFG